MSSSDEKSEILESVMTSSRRGFLGQAGLATLGVMGASKLSAAVSGPLASFVENKAALTASDIAILNFALNLEYLEAEFYLRAVTGDGLDDSDTTGKGTRGDVTGGSQVPFQTQKIMEYAQEIAADELAHVKFLRTVLGSNAVARPKIDLDQSFTDAARAAGLIGSGETFSPFADEQSFLVGAFTFEDVGVTAYHGAAALIKSKVVLDAAAGILAVEAYHAGLIRTVMYQLGLVAQAKAISDLRDAADGAGDRDQGIVMNGTANIVPTDANGIAYERTTTMVANIVYLKGASSTNGFFPNKLNGSIR